MFQRSFICLVFYLAHGFLDESILHWCIMQMTVKCGQCYTSCIWKGFWVNLKCLELTAFPVERVAIRSMHDFFGVMVEPVVLHWSEHQDEVRIFEWPSRAEVKVGVASPYAESEPEHSSAKRSVNPEEDKDEQKARMSTTTYSRSAFVRVVFGGVL